MTFFNQVRRDICENVWKFVKGPAPGSLKNALKRKFVLSWFVQLS
jgi:hypothetical protein